MTRDERRRILWGPLGALVLLLALMGTTIAIAYLPIPGGRPGLNITISVLQIAIIALFLMQLRRAAGLVRMAALAGVIWASFLYLFAFSDYLTR
jgi:cytochrome c oxidase subunit 4